MIFGYLDPGSGSLILQVVLGGAAGVAVAFKALKNKVPFLRKRSEEPAGEEPAAEAETPESPAVTES